MFPCQADCFYTSSSHRFDFVIGLRWYKDIDSDLQSILLPVFEDIVARFSARRDSLWPGIIRGFENSRLLGAGSVFSAYRDESDGVRGIELFNARDGVWGHDDVKCPFARCCGNLGVKTRHKHTLVLHCNLCKQTSAPIPLPPTIQTVEGLQLIFANTPSISTSRPIFWRNGTNTNGLPVLTQLLNPSLPRC